jgi:hypothetical protein
MVMQQAAGEKLSEPPVKKAFVPKYPDIPVREDYSSAADGKFWSFFPHNMVSVLTARRRVSFFFVSRGSFRFSQQGLGKNTKNFAD